MGKTFPFVHTGMWELWKSAQAEISTLLISASLQVLQLLKPAKHMSFAGASSSSVACLWNLSSATEQINNIQHLFKWSNHTPAVIVWSVLKNNKLKSILYFRVRVCHAWHLIIISLLEDKNSYCYVDKANLQGSGCLAEILGSLTGQLTVNSHQC